MKVKKTYSLDLEVVKIMDDHIDNKSGYVNDLIRNDIKKHGIKIIQVK